MAIEIRHEENLNIYFLNPAGPVSVMMSLRHSLKSHVSLYIAFKDGVPNSGERLLSQIPSRAVQKYQYISLLQYFFPPMLVN